MVKNFAHYNFNKKLITKVGAQTKKQLGTENWDKQVRNSQKEGRLDYLYTKIKVALMNSVKTQRVEQTVEIPLVRLLMWKKPNGDSREPKISWNISSSTSRSPNSRVQNSAAKKHRGQRGVAEHNQHRWLQLVQQHSRKIKQCESMKVTQNNCSW